MIRRNLSVPTLLSVLALVGVLALPLAAANAADASECVVGGKERAVVTARVVALDAVIYNNRMGANLPGGMIFALAEDVEATDTAGDDWTQWNAGQVALKDYKRPRPIVLRVNKGQCLKVEFRNLVATTPTEVSCRDEDGNPTPNCPCASPPCDAGQSTTRQVGLHAQGMEWVEGPQDDGGWSGFNDSSYANPGDPPITYLNYAAEEGTFLLYSNADTYTGGGVTGAVTNGDGGQLQSGLFGALTVQPEVAEYYRSQVNREDLCLARKGSTWANGTCTAPAGLPEIVYDASYPKGHPRAGLPILSMICPEELVVPSDPDYPPAQACTPGELVHSDLTAIITGPDAGRFPDSMATLPEFHDIPVSPDRLEPYREFTIIYHEVLRSVQAFSPAYTASQLQKTLEQASDNFAFNYGMGGIGSEILANRFKVGPMAECTDCKYEEFFLSSWPNGDPAMIVDNPADSSCGDGGVNNDYTQFKCTGDNPATQSFFPDDPSNVYHGYLWDHTKMRVLHGGSDLHHLHHLHAHQWLHSSNTSSGHYLDSQAIGPGSSFTLEMTYNGSGNKNLTVGDSIFHCHFYPHFAAGMWALWRVHDVLEEGTELTSYPQGIPVQNARAQPDGEIVAGTPIPAVVPMPTKALAPVPAPVRLVDDGKMIEVCTDDTFTHCVSNLATATDLDIANPGYPFFIPGVGGSRAPHPPLDFALACSSDGSPCDTLGTACGGGGTCETLDGGLPRHVVRPGGETHFPPLNPLDFSKDVEVATGIGLPEEGTAVEQVAMAYHAERSHTSQTPEGNAAKFTTNGHPAAPGAPYAEPCIELDGSIPTPLPMRSYWAVNLQLDATFNKEGWHYPQERIISLWGDAFDFLGLTPDKPQKAPEPFFFRANSNDCVTYHHANLVPKTFELDDFEVRTPTDILGQHIHLVKFDVTSSDGAANGWNYEDGTLAPDEVIERINAFNNGGFKTTIEDPPQSGSLKPEFIQFFGADAECPPNQSGKSSDDYCNCRVTMGTDEKGNTKYSVAGGRWCGAQTTVQRWYVDPQLTNQDNDRTVRTVFTHDHFGPSTHQQGGLYAGMLAEPEGSVWLNNETGTAMGGAGISSRVAKQNGVNLPDGGPTSWQAIVKTAEVDDSYREFLFEFQDTTLLYEPFAADIVSFLDGKCPPGVACGFCSTDHDQICTTDANSDLYYGKVCPTIALPIPGETSTSSLEGSCNYIPGIPSNDNLFLGVAGTTTANIWGLEPGSELDELRAIGWATTPIDTPPSGLWVANRQTTAAQPEAISFFGGSHNFTMNYRSEPIYSRIAATSSNDRSPDLSYVYASLDRTVAGAVSPVPYSTAPLTSGVLPEDPFTPLLRAYAGDNVQIRTLVGAHQNPHNLTIHGTKWLFEPTNANSGWRASQIMGISEHFELLFELPARLAQPEPLAAAKPWTDYLYKTTAQRAGQVAGAWGLMRAYDAETDALAALPNNEPPATPPEPDLPVCPQMVQGEDGTWTLPADATNVQRYNVVAITAKELLPGGTLIYNSRGNTIQSPDAILYVLEEDIDALKSGARKPEPLVLRAAAGDCIQVQLTNQVNPADLGPDQGSGQIPVAGSSATNRDLYFQGTVSSRVGLHPQLVSYDVRQSDGTNAGWNPIQTRGRNQKVTYYWYAGNIDPSAATPHIPIEFGATNLLPSDPINHHAYSLFGGLIIEPLGATWTADPNTRTQATVTYTNHGGEASSFREFVALVQDDIVLRNAQGARQGNNNGLNYATEKLIGQRTCTDSSTVDCVLSSLEALCNGTNCDDPQTPIFCAQAGDPVRFRWLHPGGALTNEIMEIFGHVFAEEPYLTAADHCGEPITQWNPYASQIQEVGNLCPDGNVEIGPTLSDWRAVRMGHGPTNHYDVLLPSAGGTNAVPGDYLYRTFQSLRYSFGIWGLFRVIDEDFCAEDPARCACPSGFALPGNAATISAGGG